MTDVVEQEGLDGVMPYLDDVFIGGADRREHDLNVKAFFKTCEERGITLKYEKSVRGVSQIKLLGYVIRHGSISPDPDRLEPPRRLKPPTSIKELKRTVGMRAYYAKWIPDFGTKVHPLATRMNFRSVSKLSGHLKASRRNWNK